MKNILVNGIIFICILALGACEKDEGNLLEREGFLLSITENIGLPYVVTSREQIVFDVTIGTSSNVTMQHALLSLDGNDLQSVSPTSNEVHLQHTYAVTAQDVGKSLVFRLTVTDTEGKSVYRDFTIYVQSAPPDITVAIPESAPTQIGDDETAGFIINIVSENDMRYIKTFLDQTEITSLTKENFVDPKEDDYHFMYQPTSADADRTLEFTIEVMDVLGNIHRHPYSLFVERSQEADFNLYSDVNMGAQNNTAYGHFFNSSTGEVYGRAGSSALWASIDLALFYSGATTAFIFASPTSTGVRNNIYNTGNDAMNSWPDRNNTLIKKISPLTAQAFNQVASSADIEALYTETSGSGSDTSSGLANGDGIVFMTESGKYAVLRVTGRTGNGNTHSIVVDVKVQK